MKDLLRQHLQALMTNEARTGQGLMQYAPHIPVSIANFFLYNISCAITHSSSDGTTERCSWTSQFGAIPSMGQCAATIPPADPLFIPSVYGASPG